MPDTPVKDLVESNAVILWFLLNSKYDQTPVVDTVTESLTKEGYLRARPGYKERNIPVPHSVQLTKKGRTLLQTVGA